MTVRVFTLLLSALLLLPEIAFAHIGQGAGIHHGDASFLVGLWHPFTGFDHLAAMIAVGIWSAMTTRRIWVAPIAFAGMLLVGGLIGFAGVGIPVVEPMIAASLLVLGLMVAAQVKMPVAATAMLVGVFALFHGIAHGSELPAERAVAALSGMVLGTMLLHIGGLLFGHYLRRRNVWLPRAVGTVVALLGAGLLTGVV